MAIRTILLGLILSITILNAQTDTEFWFAAPDVSSAHGIGARNGTPINLHITAQNATTVTVDRPADASFTPIVFNLNTLEHRTIRLDGALLAINEIENYPSGDTSLGVQNKGFRITAGPGQVTAYYELDQFYNRDFFPLKGRNALGTNFVVSTQNYNRNGNYSGTAFSGFVIVAAENNTVVTVYPNKDLLHFNAPDPIIVRLNQGETFAFRGKSTAVGDHPNGVRVQSTKNIAITTYDDSMFGTPQSCRDIFGDQIVPISILGREYVVMRGDLNAAVGDKVYITATQVPTVVSINKVIIDTIKSLDSTHYYPITIDTTYIKTSQPSFVIHLTGFGCELGGALLPPIDNCTGSHDVTFTRSNNTVDSFFLNIMARNDTNDASVNKNQAINNFTVTTNSGTVNVPSNFFNYFLDSAFIVLRNTPAVDNFFSTLIGPGEEVLVQNRISRFHLGVINGGAMTGCKYGYFSDYAANGYNAGIGGATAARNDVFCNLDPFQLVAEGGLEYTWSCTSDPLLTSKITDVKAAAPFFDPDDPGIYTFNVNIKGECDAEADLPMTVFVILGPTSNFTLDEVIGCSPFTVEITNTTDSLAKEMRWDFETTIGEVPDSSLPRTFTQTFTNFTDSIETHSIVLYSKANFNQCPNFLRRTIQVKPGVEADFSASDTVGCHPLSVVFSDSSSGNIDSTSYSWDFGDNIQSFDTSPSHQFNNFTPNLVTYPVELVVTSPFGCTDTAWQDIDVYPRIVSQFSIDSNYGCSPFSFNLSPSGSIGIDTLYWFINDGTKNIIYKNLDLVPVSHTHRDTTYATGPDTLLIMLAGINRYGCLTNSQTDTLVVYPEIQAKLTVDNANICDSVPITFDNLSLGNNLDFEWDFGDFTFLQDPTLSSHTKTYFNRNDSTIFYKVELKAISEYKCESLHDTLIQVRPYINAGFGLNYTNNCSPLNVAFNNTSTRVHNYFWDMGDGTTYTYDTNSFSHTFVNTRLASDTTFIIKLVGQNKEGCQDSTTRSIYLYQPVIADFDIADTIGCAPFNAELTNLSTGTDLIYSWNFGDGISNSTSLTNFTKEYNNFSANDTNYVITLTARNLAGCDSIISKDVDVFAFIDANFSLPVVDSCSPLTLRLNNQSSQGSKFTEWDFDNGTTSTDYNPIPPTYTVANTYNVRLITYSQADAEHLACADTHIVAVDVRPELICDFDIDVDTSCQPLRSGITNKSTPKPGTFFTWEIDDQFYSPLETPTDLNIPNLSDTTQKHTIKLLGTTQYGCKDTITKDITVYSLVNAYFTLDRPAICSGDSFLVDRTGTRGGVDKYFWNFDPGWDSNRNDSIFYISYENPTNNTTTKIVTLRVENSAGCDSTWSNPVNVYPVIKADFEFDDSVICYPHLTSFTNNSVNASEYFWDFGDGTSSTESTPSITYSNTSTINSNWHNVKLIAKSSALCLDSITKPIIVHAKPMANFDFVNALGCSPFTAEMNNTSVGSNLTYYWDLAQESETEDKDASYTFTNLSSVIEEKPINLYIESEYGCKDTLQKTLSVYPQAKVDFTMSKDKFCSPDTAKFFGQFSNILQMQWYLDDNVAFSTIEKPTYRFENETPNDKTHTIKLVGTSLYGCIDSAEHNLTVYPTPNADFIADPTPTNYNADLDYTTVTFHNETVFQENWDYFWSYGDGITNQDNRKVNDYNYGYLVWGDINNHNQLPVQLIAYNKNNRECSDTANHRIIINPPLPQVDLDVDIEGCIPFTVNFNSTTKYNYEDKYDWDFGITGESSKKPTPSYTYDKPGVYTVKLTVYGDGGVNWDYKIISVNPKPEAAFSYSDSLVYDSSQTKGFDWIQFYNQSKYASKYRWYFNSEGLFQFDTFDPYADTLEADSYEEEPAWAYPELGQYFVTLVAESGKGCLDTATTLGGSPIRVVGEGFIKFPTGFFVNPESAPSGQYDSDQRQGNLYLFYPHNIGVNTYNLQVFDRWGVLVFETDDVNEGWNGYIDGVPAKQDVYVWVARGTFNNMLKFEKSGDVTLIRAPVNVDLK